MNFDDSLQSLKAYVVRVNSSILESLEVLESCQTASEDVFDKLSQTAKSLMLLSQWRFDAHRFSPKMKLDLIALCGTTLVDVVCSKAKWLKQEDLENADACFNVIAYYLRNSLEHLCDVVLYAEKIDSINQYLARLFMRKVTNSLKKNANTAEFDVNLFLKLLALYCKYLHLFGSNKVTSSLRKQLKSIKCPPGIDQWMKLHGFSVVSRSSASEYLDKLSWGDCEKWLDAFADQQSSNVSTVSVNGVANDQSNYVGTNGFIIDTGGTVPNECEFFTEACDAVEEHESCGSPSLPVDNRCESNAFDKSGSFAESSMDIANHSTENSALALQDASSTLHQFGPEKSVDLICQDKNNSMEGKIPPSKRDSEADCSDMVTVAESRDNQCSLIRLSPDDTVADLPKKDICKMNEEGKSCFDAGIDNALISSILGGCESIESKEDNGLEHSIAHSKGDSCEKVTDADVTQMPISPSFVHSPCIENQGGVEIVDSVISDEYQLPNIINCENSTNEMQASAAELDTSANYAQKLDTLPGKLKEPEICNIPALISFDTPTSDQECALPLSGEHISPEKRISEVLSQFTPRVISQVDNDVDKTETRAEGVAIIQKCGSKTRRAIRTFVKSRNSWSSLIKSSFEPESNEWLGQICAEKSNNIVEKVDEIDVNKTVTNVFAKCETAEDDSNAQSLGLSSFDAKCSLLLTRCKNAPAVNKLQSLKKRKPCSIIEEIDENRGENRIESACMEPNLMLKEFLGESPTKALRTGNAGSLKNTPAKKCGRVSQSRAIHKTPLKKDSEIAGGQTPRYLTRSQSKTHKNSLPLDTL